MTARGAGVPGADAVDRRAGRLNVVAFILITEHAGARLYPVAELLWRRFLVPVVGSLAMGYLLFDFFRMRAAAACRRRKRRCGRAAGHFFATVFGKFFCTSATLASGIPLGREGPAVQVGAGIASLLGRYLGLVRKK